MRLALPTVLAFATLATACQKAPEGPPPPPSTQPMARDTPPPEYPEALACDGIGGQVVLMLQVGPDGRTAGVQLHRTSGHKELDDAAVTAVRGWEFRPATAAGRPVSKKIQVPVTFRPPQVRPERCFVLDEQRRRGQAPAG